MTDPFPALTNFLESLLLYSIYLGIILATISGVIAGLLFLPVFGDTEQRKSRAMAALRGTLIGVLIILLALPARGAILRFFPVPAGLPPLPTAPLTTPGTTPTVRP